MEGEKNSCFQRKKSPVSFPSLNFIKCVFFTNEQLNDKQVHKPKQSLFFEKNVKETEIETTINQTIDEVHSKMREIYKKDVKVPFPIFVLLGRQLDYHSNIFENELFMPLPLSFSSTITYGKAQIQKTGSQLAIIDYIKGFFNSGLSNKEDNRKYNSSLINTYKFQGNIKLLIYIPYLTNKYKFISNFTDLSNSFFFFSTLMNSNSYMDIDRTSTFNSVEYRKKLSKNGLDSRTIDFLINIITSSDKKKYPLYDDLMNLCYDGGCVSNEGEDFDSLIPQFTNDDDTNNKNADEKSPFIPNKCLSKTNGFLCNIRFAENNKDIPEFIKENAMKDIQENLSAYTLITDKIQRKEKLSKIESDYVSNYTSPVNLIISVIKNFIKEHYSKNLNDDKKGDIKLNHYSKNYSENVIKELAYLKKLNGIPEFVMSLYRFKENTRSDKIAYMPFGTTYPTKVNIFNFGDTFEVDEVLYSFNKSYGMKLNSSGFVFIFEVNSGNILYFLNKTYIKKPLQMTIQENGVLITYETNEGNITSKNYLNSLSSLVADCEDCLPPFSLILNDNGTIRIYGNGFYDATSKEFNDFINKEKGFISSQSSSQSLSQSSSSQISSTIPMNIMDLSSITSTINNEVIRKESYIFCSSSGCKT